MIDLKGKSIFVMTNPEMGWDCVVGVYLANSEDEVIEYLGDEYDEDVAPLILFQLILSVDDCHWKV